jgi:hypothetical protein
VTDEWGLAGKVTEGVAATHLTIPSDREVRKDSPAEYVLLSRAADTFRKWSTTLEKVTLPFFVHS